jgi:hypothetical protein
MEIILVVFIHEPNNTDNIDEIGEVFLIGTYRNKCEINIDTLCEIFAKHFSEINVLEILKTGAVSDATHCKSLIILSRTLGNTEFISLENIFDDPRTESVSLNELYQFQLNNRCKSAHLWC